MPIKNFSEPATFRFVVQCHLVPHRELYTAVSSSWSCCCC